MSTAALELPGGLRGRLTGRLFFDVPRISLVRDGSNAYRLAVRGWGPLEATVRGVGTIARTVLLDASLSVPPVVTVVRSVPRNRPAQVRSTLRFGLDAAAAEVLDLDARVSEQGTLPPEVEAALSGAALRQVFTRILRRTLAGQSPAPFALEFLGGLQRGTLTPTATVLDGALAVGLDVAWDAETRFAFTTPVDTAGTPGRLTDIRRGGDVAYWINTSQIETAFVEIAEESRRAVQGKGTLERLRIRARAGALRVEGRASNDEGTATFTFDVIPSLTTSPFPWEERLLFTTRTVDVDVTISAGRRAAQVILGIVTAGLFALGVERLVDAYRAGLERLLDRRTSNRGARNRQITLPGSRHPVIDLRIERYAISRGGVFSEMRLRPRLTPARVTGVSRLFADGRGRAQLLYAVTLPTHVLRSDPLLRVRWTTRRLDRNEVVDQVEGPAATARVYRADLTLDDTASPPRVNLSCRVYRHLGDRTEEILNQTVTPSPTDPLDASRPYVRWRAIVPLPSFIVEADGSLTRNGLAALPRASRIHRTDLPGRCLFAATYSTSFATLEYLDELPFPVAELPHRRAAVCDYCFFGGPTGTEVLLGSTRA
jgi:hypothetical protein